MNTQSKIRIAQFGLGPIGIACLRLLATKPWVEVVGGIDIRPELAGKRLADLAGAPALGDAKVFGSFTELCAAAQVDAVLHTAGSRAAVSLEQMAPMIERGVAIVSSCEELLFPALRAPRETEAADAQCRRTGARILGTGVNPGFVLDVLPLCLSGVCASVDGVYGERVVNASTRRQPLQKKIGSGMDPKEFVELGRTGKAGHAGFKETVMLLAHALGWPIGPISEEINAVIATERIQTEHFTIEIGQTAGLHQIVKARTPDGRTIHLDLKMYQGAKDPHDTIRLQSSPPIEATVNGGVAGDLATVAALVNAVPRLLKAAPGVRLMTDLSLPCCPSAV
jgi:2,4-diaminopentanoate dehydrogenase